MKYVGPVRKELGIRTVFNILGPLTNPARACMQVMGVYDEGLLEPMAKALSNLGVKRGMVVYGCEKLDEISICGPTSICCFKEGKIRMSTITPESAGLKRGNRERFWAVLLPRMRLSPEPFWKAGSVEQSGMPLS